jgi:hypothetical protein
MVNRTRILAMSGDLDPVVNGDLGHVGAVITEREQPSQKLYRLDQQILGT